MTVLYIVLGLLAVLIAVMLIRTARFTKHPGAEQAPLDTGALVNDDEVAAHLSAVIQCATVSNADMSKMDFGEFEKLHRVLRESYPLVHETMEREQLGGYNLIYRWKGTDPARKPICFLSHQDVVPPGDLSQWKYPPFSGYDDGTCIHGRGAVDMKQQMVLVLDACERLIKEGFTPEEDIYLCFGQNEEVGNRPAGHGADLIAQTLKERGLRFDCVLDEGGAIISGKTAGVNARIAVVGMAEKGMMGFRLECEAAGGHSSRPPKHSALGKVCAAAAYIENHPGKPRLIPLVEDAYKTMAAYSDKFPLRFAAANLPLTRGLLAKLLTFTSLTRAMVTNTVALTQAEGSAQDNVLPQRAWVGINSRTLPNVSVDDMQRFFESRVKDKDVRVVNFRGQEKNDISRYDTAAFGCLCDTVERFYPGTVVTPYLQLGGSDSKNYYCVSDNVYRFMPVYLEKGDAAYGVHAVNEYIPKDLLGRGTAFIMHFIKEYKGEKV